MKIQVMRFDYTILIDNQEEESDNEEVYLYDVVMTQEEAYEMFDVICDRAFINGDEVFGGVYAVVIDVQPIEEGE